MLVAADSTGSFQKRDYRPHREPDLPHYLNREMKPLRLLSPSLCFLLCSIGQAADKPNIIVIMAADLGYGDVSCYGATAFQTPNIDRLAAEGQRFTSGYCSASTCTPTRYSF